MTGELSKNFRGVDIGPLSNILTVNYWSLVERLIRISIFFVALSYDLTMEGDQMVSALSFLQVIFLKYFVK